MSLKSSLPYVFGVLAVAAGIAATPSAAQVPASPSDTRTALVKDIGNLSDKFTGLARVMAGKYDWRPGQGVRSVGEVFNLIVTENHILASVLSGTGSQAPGGGTGRGSTIVEPAALQEALRTSFASVSQALSALAAADLNTSITLFGQQTTKEGAVLMVVLDQHEHLGQSIAYARTNGIVPPWSK